MSSFTSPLELEYIDGRQWLLKAPFSYYTGADANDPQGETILVPEGFITDFASIPRPLWITMPPTGPWGKAAVIHDYLYRNGGLVVHAYSPTGITYREFSRGECDQIFREAMEVLGVGWYRRNVMYLGVRAGGWASFKGKKEIPHDN